MEKMREFIKNEMSKRNWRAAEFARQSGIPSPTITRFLKGRHKEWSYTTMVMAAKAFGMSIDQFIDGCESVFLPIEKEKLEPKLRCFVFYKGDKVNGTLISNMFNIKDRRLAEAISLLCNADRYDKVSVYDDVLFTLSELRQEILDQEQKKLVLANKEK